MRYILFLLLPVSIFAQASFITPMEYASSLYQNPRGIGCQNCHGIAGEGRVVANYEHESNQKQREKKSFVGPEINSMNFNDFYVALNVRKNGMPRYFLTHKEIQALYFYVQEKKKQLKEKK